MISRLLRNIKFWYFLGLAGAALLWFVHGEKGPYWFVEPLLYFTFFTGLWLDSRYHFRKRLAPSRWKAAFAYFGIFLATAMVYEVSLFQVNARSLGSHHPKAIPSLIIIFGSYLVFSLFNLFLIRRYHYTFKELYFAAGAASLTEGVVFNGVLTAVLLSPMFFLAPLTFAYYMLVYGVIFCMPFVFIQEKLLWSRVENTISFRRKILYAFIATWLGYIVWGTGWVKMVNILTNGFEKF